MGKIWRVLSNHKDSVRFNVVAVYNKEKKADRLVELLKDSTIPNMQYWVEKYEREEYEA